MSKTITITVNKRDMKFTKNGNSFHLPQLISIDKLGRKNFWECYVIDNHILRKSWIESSDSKIREYPKISKTGKNIGRKNETTDHQQALFDAYSLWLNKQTKNYRETVNEKDIIRSQILLPMLAQKYTERKHLLKLPFGVSEKLDGVRVLSKMINNKIRLTSRNGKEYNFMDQIRVELSSIIGDYTLDGEVYSHDIPFEAISGAARTKKKPSIYDEQLEYWIFDIAIENIVYSERMNILKKLEKEYNKYYPDSKHLHFVYYTQLNTLDDVKKYHDKYVEQGYEGLMCRNLDGVYKFKYRSNDLQKYKEFEDDEYKIVDIRCGDGTERGAIIFVCECNGRTFDVRPRGSISRRQEMYKERKKYLGKMLTVRHQTTGIIQENSLPRLPVGIDIRDYE